MASLVDQIVVVDIESTCWKKKPPQKQTSEIIEAAMALAELGRLADTGDFTTAGRLVQHRRSADPNTYLGMGKLRELRLL